MNLSQLQEATATNNRASCNYTREPLRVHTRRQTLSMSKNCNVITRRGRARLNRYALPRKQWIGRFPVTLNCQHICQLLLRLRGHYVCLFIIIPRRRLHIHISRDRSMLEDFTFTERFSEWPSLIILLEWLWMKGWSQSTVVSCWQDSNLRTVFFCLSVFRPSCTAWLSRLSLGVTLTSTLCKEL